MLQNDIIETFDSIASQDIIATQKVKGKLKH